MFQDRKRSLPGYERVDGPPKVASQWMFIVYVLLVTGGLWIFAAVVIHTNIEDEVPTPPPTPFLGRVACLPGFTGCMLEDALIPDNIFDQTNTPYPTAAPTAPTTQHPTDKPATGAPTTPTVPPTHHPTKFPTKFPTILITDRPTFPPTGFPTPPPTETPTTGAPTDPPTRTPTTAAPTQAAERIVFQTIDFEAGFHDQPEFINEFKAAVAAGMINQGHTVFAGQINIQSMTGGSLIITYFINSAVTAQDIVDSVPSIVSELRARFQAKRTVYLNAGNTDVADKWLEAAADHISVDVVSDDGATIVDQSQHTLSPTTATPTTAAPTTSTPTTAAPTTAAPTTTAPTFPDWRNIWSDEQGGAGTLSETKVFGTVLQSSGERDVLYSANANPNMKFNDDADNPPYDFCSNSNTGCNNRVTTEDKNSEMSCVNQCIEDRNAGFNCIGVNTEGGCFLFDHSVFIPGTGSYLIKDPETGAFRYNVWEYSNDANRETRPVIFAVHGGGFQGGFGGLDPTNPANPMDEFANYYAEKGFLIIEVTYSDYCYDGGIISFLGNNANDAADCKAQNDLDATYGMPICNGYDTAEQAAAQVRGMIDVFVASTSGEHYYNFDRSNMFVMGMSAGGFTTVSLMIEIAMARSTTNSEYTDIPGIRGFIPMASGWYDNLLQDQLTVDYRIIQGTADQTVNQCYAGLLTTNTCGQGILDTCDTFLYTTNKRCDEEFGSLATEAECENIATQLGFPFEADDYNSKPAGCYLHSDTVRFQTGTGNSRNKKCGFADGCYCNVGGCTYQPGSETQCVSYLANTDHVGKDWLDDVVGGSTGVYETLYTKFIEPLSVSHLN